MYFKVIPCKRQLLGNNFNYYTCASLIGLRLITEHGTTDIQEATALNYKYDDIDIYSNSWGPSDSGFYVDGPQLLTRMAFEKGVRHVSDYK